MRLAALALLTLLAGLPAPPAAAAPTPVERVAVRFTAPELGGARSPRFVLQHVLAFEARLAALTSGERIEGFRERHITAALERHVSEILLANLRIEPEPPADLVTRQATSARRMLEERVGGPELLSQAARAEGISERELLALFRRQARASLYLDRMVAPMLQPSTAELRALHRSGRTPWSAAPFETIQPGLRRWYVSTRLNDSLQSYYQNARSRLDVVVIALPASTGAQHSAD
ncbi:MAG TPA: hypothetical protein VM686_42575 [Polyangiaceae bacterium]|nr:hypothetical protein [Polyangiaceae bacterium]